MDNILIVIIVTLAVIMCSLEALSCGIKYIECDEGRFTCVKRFLGGEPIYKQTDTTWWLWPEETEVCGISMFAKRLQRKMIICHNCKFVDSF